MGESSIIWAIVALILYAFSSFKKNYDKEQEKARKRNPQIPVDNEIQERPVEQTANFPIPGPTNFPPVQRNRPVNEQRDRSRRLESKPRKNLPPLPQNDVYGEESYQMTREAASKPTHKSLQEVRKSQLKRQVEIPEEVLKLRAYREQKRREAEKFATKKLSSSQLNLGKAVELSIMDDEENPKNQMDFDLKKAVIYSAVLERKYF